MRKNVIRYDALRRRISLTTGGTAIASLPQPTVLEEHISFTTNNLNQYTQIVSVGRDFAPAYDENGSLVTDDKFQYAYDAENRLISATPLDPGSDLKKVEFGYDYMSRRMSKTTYTYATGAWTLDTDTTFVYDGWNVIQETTTGSSTSTAQYVWGLDLSGSLLAIFEEVDFDHTTLELCSGDSFFVCSDGVLDICDSKKERFGKERLRQMLNQSFEDSRDLDVLVRDALVQFGGPGPWPDDTSFLIVRAK